MTTVRNKRILLKDGSVLGYSSCNQANIRRGTYLRYRAGLGAIMRVDTVEEDAHGFRLSGINILGDSHGAYAHDCIPATPDDRKAWDSYCGDRMESA